MTELGWDHSALVRVSGQSSSVVSQWLGKGSKPIHSIGKMEAAERIEQASGYCALWIAKGKGPERVASNTNASDFLSGTVHPYSDTNTVRAPVVEWARLGTELYKESRLVDAAEYIDTPHGASSSCKWFVVDEGIPAFRIKKGYKIALDPVLDGHSFVNDDIYLFSDVDGMMFLAEYRKVANGFEAVLASGKTLESGKHGLSILAIHRGTWK